MLKAHLFVLMMLISTKSTASSAPPAAPSHDSKPDSTNQGHQSPGESHSTDEHGAEAEKAPVVQGPRREYNPGTIVAFPSLEGERLDKPGTVTLKPQKGHSAVVIFIASWCEPCQSLMPEFKRLAKKYGSESTDFYFVFAHDTRADAIDFIKGHQLIQKSVLANPDLLTAFKNPELPSVYLSDKYGYLAERFLKLKKSEIEQLDALAAKLTLP